LGGDRFRFLLPCSGRFVSWLIHFWPFPLPYSVSCVGTLPFPCPCNHESPCLNPPLHPSLPLSLPPSAPPSPPR
jgi:hypothetical protein